MRLRAGTSGFSFPEWKGRFYPDGLAEADMLGYYATRLPAVEINNTFYRMPKSAVMLRWAEVVPEGFVLAIKASRRITHQAKLADTDELIGYLWSSVSKLGAHLGPVLFQLPPYLRKDAGLLAAFLASLPPQMLPVIEFNHTSWLDDEVRAVLETAGAVACVADKERLEPPLWSTADWGYVRLHRPGYDDAALAAWVERIRAQPWREAFVFFKHDADVAGPEAALRLAAMFGQ